MTKKIYISSFVAICLCVAAAAQEKKTTTSKKKSDQDHISIDGSSLRWEHRSDEEGTNITLVSKNVEFNDDYTDVERIKGDGYFRLSEERGGVLRRLEATPGADGQLKRQYWERGEVRPFDDGERKWLAKLLSSTVAGSGYDAEARVGRILKKGGANAVLNEIGRLKTDYARRVYASALIEQGNLDGGQMAKLLSQTSSAIGSDYEKATLLIKVLKNNLTDAAVGTAFFGMANTLGSDYERGRVLAVLLKLNNLSTENLMLALRSVGGMSSDYEKANVLIRASNTGATDASVRAAIIEAAHTLGSDHERGRVLTAVTKKQL